MYNANHEYAAPNAHTTSPNTHVQCKSDSSNFVADLNDVCAKVNNNFLRKSHLTYLFLFAGRFCAIDISCKMYIGALFQRRENDARH